MLHAFLINPDAGKKGAAKKAAARIDAFCRDRGLDYAVTVTDSPGDAIRATRHYADAGRPARLYACGGDGTLNRVVQAAAGADHLAVTNIPLGTGNDFLKIFGPENKDRFWDLDALCGGPQAPMDLIDCNGTLGLDIVCAGVDARVAADVERYKALPLVAGKGAYTLSLAANVLFKGIARPMRVEMDGRTWDQDIALVCVCNGRYYGGGFMPVGEAMPDDGVLDCLVVPKVSLPTFARLVGDYSKGQYAKHPDRIAAYHGPGPITLSAHAPITYVADGEVFSARELTIRLSDKKVNFFWPTGLDYAVKTQPELAAVGN